MAIPEAEQLSLQQQVTRVYKTEERVWNEEQLQQKVVEAVDLLRKSTESLTTRDIENIVYHASRLTPTVATGYLELDMRMILGLQHPNDGGSPSTALPPDLQQHYSELQPNVEQKVKKVKDLEKVIKQVAPYIQAPSSPKDERPRARPTWNEIERIDREMFEVFKDIEW